MASMIVSNIKTGFRSLEWVSYISILDSKERIERLWTLMCEVTCHLLDLKCLWISEFDSRENVGIRK